MNDALSDEREDSCLLILTVMFLLVIGGCAQCGCIVAWC